MAASQGDLRPDFLILNSHVARPIRESLYPVNFAQAVSCRRYAVSFHPMWKIKLLISLILLAAIASVGVVVTADNSEKVSPVVFGLQTYSASLGVWLFTVLLVGGILGFLVSWFSGIKSRGQKSMLARKLKSCEQELAQLRTGSLRD